MDCLCIRKPALAAVFVAAAPLWAQAQTPAEMAGVSVPSQALPKTTLIELGSGSSVGASARSPEASSPWVKTGGSGQARLSLMLRDVLESALATHPSLQAARLLVRAAAQDKSAVERQRYPTISMVAETDPGANNSAASRSIRVDQTVWDAGRNSARIDEAQARIESAQAQVYVQQQDLFLQIINVWQNLLAANERVSVARQTLERLHAYREQMVRRVDAQASPTIDLELAHARVLQTEVELNTAQTAWQVAVTRLEQLSGLPQVAERLKKLPSLQGVEADVPLLKSLDTIDWQLQASQSPTVVKARNDRTIVDRQLDMKRAELWPQLYVRVDQPFKTSTTTNTKMSTFAGLRYTPGAGLSGLSESRAIAARIESQDQTVEAALREAQQTLQNEREEFVNARSRILALARAEEGAVQVLQSYQRQFQAGRKTWQDLLNAVRELAQNQYSLADARASMMGAQLRLQLRLGDSPDFP